MHQKLHRFFKSWINTKVLKHFFFQSLFKFLKWICLIKNQQNESLIMLDSIGNIVNLLRTLNDWAEEMGYLLGEVWTDVAEQLECIRRNGYSRCLFIVNMHGRLLCQVHMVEIHIFVLRLCKTKYKSLGIYWLQTL